MKRILPAFLAIVICVSVAFYWSINQRPNSASTTQTPRIGEILDIKNAGEGFQYIAQIDFNKLGS